MENNKKIKIQIKSIFGDLLFEYEKENNTIKYTVEEAVRQNVSLNGASLNGASLNGASLNGASLDGASLNRASLDGAENIPYIPFACPSDGAFIGWKKVSGHLIKLEIPEDAIRCSATTNKCRCDKAMVVSITDIKTGTERKHITNQNYVTTTYTVGKMVYPDAFDENRWNECSNGIHFFINKQEAINY